MVCIVAGILSLMQHLKILQETPELYSPKCCPHCGKLGVWMHGHYPRKADRSPRGELNPIFIQRFFCPHCQKTCSVLPECIPPRRWYLWHVQQLIFLNLLSGKSLQAVSQLASPSRSTCRRWWDQLKDRFLLHRDALCAHISELGQAINFNHFWQLCLAQLSLDRAMLLCNLVGVVIP
jgi:hypothetical protein